MNLCEIVAQNALKPLPLLNELTFYQIHQQARLVCGSLLGIQDPKIILISVEQDWLLGCLLGCFYCRIPCTLSTTIPVSHTLTQKRLNALVLKQHKPSPVLVCPNSLDQTALITPCRKYTHRDLMTLFQSLMQIECLQSTLSTSLDLKHGFGTLLLLFSLYKRQQLQTKLPSDTDASTYICTSAQFVSFQRDFRSRTILVLLDGKAPHLTLPSKQILYCTLFEDELLTLPSKPTSIVCLKDDFLKKTIRGFPHVAGVPLDCFLLVDGGIAQDTRIKHLQRPDWLSFREIGHIYYRNRSTGLCGFLYMDLDSIRLFVVGSVRDMLLMPHLDGFDYYGQSMLLQWQEMVCESVLQIRKIDNLVMFNLKLASHYHTIVCVEAHGDVELSIARMLSQTSVFCVCVCKSGSLPRTPRSIVFLDTDMHSVRQEIDPVRCRSLFLKAKLDLISFKCFQTSFLFPPPSIGPSLGPQLLWLEDAFSFAPKSLIAYLKMWSVQKSQDLAFHSLNYHQLYQNSLLIAGYLLDHMRSHEILLVLESQKIEFVQVLIGCMMSGIICFVTKCVPNDDVLDRFNIKHCWNVKCRLQSLKGRKKRDLEIDPICAQVCLIYYDQEPIWITHEILVDRMRQLTTLIDDTAFKSRKFVVCSKNVEFVLLGLYNGLEIHWILYDRWLSQAKEQAFEMGLIHLSDWNTIPKTHVMQHFKTLLIITQDPYLIQPVDHYMNLESLSVLFYDRRFGLINAQPYDNDSQSFDPLGLEYDLVVPQKQTRSSIIIQPLSQLFASVAIGDTMLLDDYRVGKIHFKSQMCHLGRESQIHGTDGFLFSGFHGFVYQQSLFIVCASTNRLEIQGRCHDRQAIQQTVQETIRKDCSVTYDGRLLISIPFVPLRMIPLVIANVYDQHRVWADTVSVQDQ